MLSLYIHIPFCKNICSYCDFYKMVVSDKLKEEVIDYIIKEIKLQKIKDKQIDNIYIGGGTPSILPIKLLKKLLSTLLEAVEIKKVREFTIEANPEDLTEDFIKTISMYGVNRVSIGIQSFDERVINFLGRKPYVTKIEILNKINLLHHYGITNINLDLIYAVPGQTIAMLNEDLNIFLTMPITHISTYSLILEDKTILKHKYDKGEFVLCNDELDLEMYKLICHKLSTNGFIHYETSNFAKKDFEGIYNKSCWQHEDYIGIGPAGASFYENKRYANCRNLNSYFSSIDTSNYVYDYFENLSNQELMEEEIILGLRLMEGINLDIFKDKYHVNLIEAFPKCTSLIERGLLEIIDNNIRIPEKHAYIANYILGKII